MDVSTIGNLIGTLGFPIVCTCAMFYMWNKEREDHKDAENKLTEAINNNTLVMEKLVDRIGGV